eukprot:COSAG02_NODE_5676_length_4138_cov_1.611785_2_plen_384_part_00
MRASRPSEGGGPPRRARHRNDGGEREFDTFENPTAEGYVSATALGNTSPRVERKSAFDIDDAPPTSDLDAVEAEHSDEGVSRGVGVDLHEHTLRRRSLSFLVFFVVSLVLLLGYVALTLFMVWVYRLVPNEMSAAAVCVAAVVPSVQYFGLSGAWRSSQPQLQLYAFLALLTVSLHISVALVVVLDTDGVLTSAYLDSCAVGARRLCQSMQDVGDVPFGVSTEDLNDVCVDCVPTESAQVINVTQFKSEGDIFVCPRKKAEERFQLQPFEIAAGMLGILVVELLLGAIAYNMIQDIDVRQAKKDAKIQGGERHRAHFRGHKGWTGPAQCSVQRNHEEEQQARLEEVEIEATQSGQPALCCAFSQNTWITSKEAQASHIAGSED